MCIRCRPGAILVKIRLIISSACEFLAIPQLYAQMTLECSALPMQLAIEWSRSQPMTARWPQSPRWPTLNGLVHFHCVLDCLAHQNVWRV